MPQLDERVLSSVPDGWDFDSAVPPLVNSSLSLVLYAATKTLPPPIHDPEADPEVRVRPVANESAGPDFAVVGGFACGASPGRWACVVSDRERRQWEWQSQRMSEEIRWLVLDGQKRADLGQGRPYVSPDGARVAWTQTVWDDASGLFRARAVLDGVEGPLFQAVEPAGFGADGAFAYRAFDGRRWGVVRNDKGRGPYNDVPELRWSPDGRRLAWIAVTEEGARVVVDGDKGPVKDLAREIRFSPDGSRLAYVAGGADGERVVLDGVEGEPRPRVGSLGFSPDGKALVVVSAREGGWEVEVDGRRGPVWDEVGPPVCGAGGERLAYAAKKGGRSFAVVDGRASEPADHVYRLLLGERGGWAHALLIGRSCALTHNGRELARGSSRPNQMALSPDGESLAWSESQDGRMRMWLDGRAGEWFDRVERPLFAPDGRTLFYVGRRGPDAWLLAGGSVHGPFEPLTDPVFEGRRAVLVTREGRDFRRRVLAY